MNTRRAMNTRRFMATHITWVALASLLLAGGARSLSTAAGAQVPAMFLFGDSLLDSGNNNNLITLAKADHPPYGIDFPEGVTGRFCNGGTVADHLGHWLGLPLIPPFNDPSTRGSNILNGVNYASGGSGILNDTGTEYGAVFTMDQQIQNFKITLQELRSQMGEGVTDFLKRSLIFICTGSNDYISNYFLPFSNKPQIYNLEAYHSMLTRQFRRQLKVLYELGGRKFLIGGIPPLGCMPCEIKHSGDSTNSCFGQINRAVSQFNTMLKAMLNKCNKKLKGSSFLYWDTYSLFTNVIHNFSRHGFKYPQTACCGEKGQLVCLPVLSPLCQNRSEYVFWDAFHPSDAFNAIAARRAYKGILQSRFPMNVRQLVQM